ncbi:MAG: general secretion pathway protein GspB [Pseudomonadota bacterium]|nr:general secretion pathway protein GspB [Pseudomonadota bacterium]
MSFILDALKKSEMERQRQTVPGLMDTRISQGRRRLPAWAVALALLLAINLIVLTVVLTRSGTKSLPLTLGANTADPQSLRSIERSPAGAALPPATDHFSPLDTAPVYAPEIPVPLDTHPKVSPPPTGRVAAAGGVGTARGALRRPDPTLIDAHTQADDQEILPSISEINLTGAQALPEMHLDVHVYATKAADRFVYINMRKYHEGASLQEGPTLERIRRDGVVLNSAGVRFILPRRPEP